MMEQKEDEASRKRRLLQLLGDYTGAETEEDLQWISKPLKIKRWVMPPEGEEWTGPIQREDGFITERIHAGYSIDADEGEMQLQEEDTYKHYYLDVFASRPHYLYLSDPHGQCKDVHNMGPIIIICEAENENSDRNVKVLIQSKTGCERIVVSPKVVQADGSVLRAIKRVQPQMNSLKFLKASHQNASLKERLLRYEEQLFSKCYKIGVLYAKEGQTTENEMYNNEIGSAQFEQFLDFLGSRVTLEGFTGFRGGLDVKTNSTGTHSVYTTFGDGLEIMFHISTLLTYVPSDPQQVERKRHIGNDVVLVVFQEGDNPPPLSPSIFQSQFNHIFMVVRPETLPDSSELCFRVAVSCKAGVYPFGPFLPDPPLLRNTPKHRAWLLTKLINAERGGYHAPSFKEKLRNTRKKQLLDIIERFQETLPGHGDRALALSKTALASLASKVNTLRVAGEPTQDKSTTVPSFENVNRMKEEGGEFGEGGGGSGDPEENEKWFGFLSPRTRKKTGSATNLNPSRPAEDESSPTPPRRANPRARPQTVLGAFGETPNRETLESPEEPEGSPFKNRDIILDSSLDDQHIKTSTTEDRPKKARAGTTLDKTSTSLSSILIPSRRSTQLDAKTSNKDLLAKTTAITSKLSPASRRKSILRRTTSSENLTDNKKTKNKKKKKNGLLGEKCLSSPSLTPSFLDVSGSGSGLAASSPLQTRPRPSPLISQGQRNRGLVGEEQQQGITDKRITKQKKKRRRRTTKASVPKDEISEESPLLEEETTTPASDPVMPEALEAQLKAHDWEEVSGTMKIYAQLSKGAEAMLSQNKDGAARLQSLFH